MFFGCCASKSDGGEPYTGGASAGCCCCADSAGVSVDWDGADMVSESMVSKEEQAVAKCLLKSVVVRWQHHSRSAPQILALHRIHST